MTKTQLYKILEDDLGFSHSTASRYLNVENAMPADVALRVQDITDSEVTAQSLRPDVFLPSKPLVQYSMAMVDVASEMNEINDAFVKLVSHFINYLSIEQPTLLEVFIADLAETRIGEEYLKQRELFGYGKLQS